MIRLHQKRAKMNPVLILVVSQLLLASVAFADCEIDPLLTNAPLLVQSNEANILYPLYGETTIKFAEGEEVDFVCPGGVVLVEGVAVAEVARSSCVSGARFLVEGSRYLWWQVTCSANAVAYSRYTGNSCVGGREAEIGFDLGNGRFIRNIQVCYDADNQVALSTHYEIPNSIGSQSTGTPRPEFEQDAGFYSLASGTVNSRYVRGGQRTAVNGLLGLSTSDTTYIKDDALYFLARGHMAARADFFYPAQQNATFKYINAAPQWQTFNGYNWNYVEASSRAYANKNNVTLQVWTGVYGVTTLPHSTTGADVPLYIYVNGNVRGIPAPAIYWKVLYEPTTRKGVVLVGVNNPYETNVAKYTYCTDISSSLNWVTWNRTNLVDGYSYACEISDLRSVVPNVPTLTTSSLLT